MAPGATAFTLILFFVKSRASDAVKDIIALLEVAYANIFFAPLILFIDATFIIEEFLAFLRKGKIYLQARKVPVTLLLRWYDQSLIDVVSKFPLNLTPALFTKTSIFLNFFLIYRARFSQSLFLVISMR